MIGLCYVSDRRDQYLPACIESFETNLLGHIDAVHTIDDHMHSLGLAGAVRAAWDWALDMEVDYLLHVEEDFVLRQPVQVEQLVYILDRNPHLAQVVLKRQPWSLVEHQAGGIVETAPDEYVDCRAFGRNVTWCEHSRIFSLNPMMVPREVLELGWPNGNEAGFTQTCIDKGLRFAFLGNRFDPPIVEHVGAQRAPGWRL